MAGARPYDEGTLGIIPIHCIIPSKKGSIAARRHSLSPVPPVTQRVRGGSAWSSGPEQPLVDYLVETNEQQSTGIERRLHIFINKDNQLLQTAGKRRGARPR